MQIPANNGRKLANPQPDATRKISVVPPGRTTPLGLFGRGGLIQGRPVRRQAQRFQSPPALCRRKTDEEPSNSLLVFDFSVLFDGN